MKKIRKKYIILSVFLLSIIAFILILFIDYQNDKKYLLSQGFSNEGTFLVKYYEGYDNYCKGSVDEGSTGSLCNVYYIKSFIHPVLGISFNFGDDNNIFYIQQKNGLLKKPSQNLSIEFGVSNIEYRGAYCQIDKDFNVIESDKNDPSCYTDEYNNYIEDNKEYIDDAMEMFYSYYDNFNLARYYNFI